MIGLTLGKPELAEDALYVLLHCPFGDEERTGDRVVGTALGDEGDDLPSRGVSKVRSSSRLLRARSWPTTSG